MIPVTLLDYKTLAKRKLSKKIFDFIDGGACDEITKRKNREAFDDINLRPLCLRDVSCVDCSTQVLNSCIEMPLLIAPTACHQLLDMQGETSTAKAAKRSSIPMIVSSMSNLSLEDIAKNSMHNQLWLQVYIFKNRALTEELVQRAEQCGYKAVVVTIGTPLMGKRDRNIRNQFCLPQRLSTGNFKSTANSKTIYDFASKELDASLTWLDIEWLQSITSLPIILKGIINPLDAEEACRLKVFGIVVSNHGGRQLDTTEATISALPDIVKIVAGRTIVLLDSGIRRGTDIFKSIALGADAVLLGSPVLWALSVSGEEGVVNMLDILKKEFEMAMKLSGCRNVHEIRQLSQYLINAQ